MDQRLRVLEVPAALKGADPGDWIGSVIAASEALEDGLAEAARSHAVASPELVRRILGSKTAREAAACTVDVEAPNRACTNRAHDGIGLDDGGARNAAPHADDHPRLSLVVSELAARTFASGKGRHRRLRAVPLLDLRTPASWQGVCAAPAIRSGSGGPFADPRPSFLGLDPV